MMRPRPSPRCGRRPGFALAEVIVAAVLVSVGVLAISATAGFARARLRVAAAEERATRAAAMVADSLRAARPAATGSGSLQLDGVLLEWSVDGDGRLELDAHFSDGAGARIRRYGTRLDGGALP
jgi:type II secretory pathway pseudopilin PulG